MNIIKYRPNRWLSVFDDSWNRVYNSFLDDFPFTRENSTPAVDVRENENGYSMEVELPGLTEKDIEVKVEGNLLTLSSKKSEEKEEEKKGYLRRERRSYSFYRSFVLPENTDAEKISVGFKNGLLTLSLPKPEKEKPKLLEIKVK
ncbi:MAG: Hsp20/alpha crystallin family protein [Spirochaetes bacterium]|nr:Hsp20/alpha crystallin family protein [Spirochaetota bacterium]